MTLLVELYLDEVWTDITSYVRVNPGVVVNFGIRDESGIADAAEITLTVNNRDGRFTPKNPEGAWRSEEHTSEPQSLMRISYADFCLKTQNTTSYIYT